MGRLIWILVVIAAFGVGFGAGGYTLARMLSGSWI